MQIVRPFTEAVFRCHLGEVMKKTLKIGKQPWLAKLIFGFALALGAGEAWGLNCEGTIYFKAPETWTSVYLMGGGQFSLGSIGASGWYEFSAARVAQGDEFQLNSTGTYYPAEWVDRTNYAVSGNQNNSANFKCSDFGSGTSLYIYEDPTAAGKTAFSTDPPNAKYFYFLPPDDQLWNSSVPMISMDGGATGVPMSTDPTRCGWFYYVWFNQEAPSSVTIFRDSDSDREEVLGWDGYEAAGTVGEVTPIPMNDVFTSFNANTLFFISDASMWPDDAKDVDKGFSIVDPVVDGNCEYKLAAIIYDTDASLHPAFSCDAYPQVNGEACQNGAQGIDQNTARIAVQACIGVTTGIVQDTLGADKKPLLKTAAMGGKGETCFISQSYFDQLFRPTAGVNEMSCFDLPFTRNSSGKWEFDSDNFTSPGAPVKGGFYPAEKTTDADILTGYGSTPVAAARTKRKAEGPIFYGPVLREINPTEGVPSIDLLCNGPGWNGGVACEGYFADGNKTDSLLKQVYGASLDCGFGWSCPNNAPSGWTYYANNSETVSEKKENPRWTSEPPTGGRNQQFCFESHAQFVYKQGLRFNFRGDDDIWVFLGGKLAVDLGGTHLAAPAYVVLDNLTDKNGNPFVEGETYDLDIFFCDRRTTMSNVRINTNMYIQQSNGINYTKDTSYVGEGTAYEICYEETGSGDCASALSGTSASQKIVYCGEDIKKAGFDMYYNLYKGSSVFSNGATTYDSTWFKSKGPGVFFGGVDLSNWYRPVINKKAIAGLPSGSYKLVASIGGKKTTWSFRVAGNLDVLTKDGQDSAKHVYKVKTSAMADVRIPVYVGAIGEEIDGYLDVDLEGAVGESYSLTFSDGLLVFADSNGTTPLTGSDRLTVGPRGIDTVWVTIPLSAMTAQTMTGTISVRKTALELSFLLPAIAFVDSTYQTQLPGYGNWDISEDSILYRGSDYAAYVMMYDPTSGAICETCNYGLEVYPASAGVTGRSALGIVDGKGVVNFRSSVLYPNAAGDSAFFTVTTTENDLIGASWRGLVFEEPPVPIPDSVMVFDTKGKPMTYAGLDMAYTSSEYLDGIADSLFIHYHRPFPKDSLPDSIRVEWSLDSTEYVTITMKQIRDAARPLTDTTYDSVLAFGGLELSSKVQTAGSGKMLESFATYKKNGVKTSGSFSKTFTDKVAPVILRANISERSEGLFQIRVSLSEKLQVSDSADKRSLFGYYLRSATNLADKYQDVPASNATVVDSSVTMFFNLSNGTIPQAGDYVRALPKLLTDLEGNGLSDYRATVPSPWMLLEGDAASTIESIKMGTVDNSVNTKKANIVANRIGIYDSLGTVRDSFPNTVGYLIKTDMGNILTDSLLDAQIASGKISLADVKLRYELDIFTNLGTFVAHKSQTIACSDSLFGGDCRTNRGYIYVGWNMVTDKGRKAGTGAYIAKLSTHVQVPIKGKTGKHNVTQTWGVRRSSK